MRLNVGCGLDVRSGWMNVDIEAPRELPGAFALADARDLSQWAGKCELVLLNHVLHLFPLREARKVLAQCAAALEPGGRLIVVEASILGVTIGCLSELTDPDLIEGEKGWHTWHLEDLVADELQPTLEGKLLEWITWHGTRRSLWSAHSLIMELHELGLTDSAWGEDDQEEWAGARAWESVVVIAAQLEGLDEAGPDSQS